MGILDWAVVAAYLVLLIGMSLYVGSRQKNQDDYYLGGRRLRPWQLGLSMAANQVSAISLVGVPAFIAVKQGGGLVWMQYEMAIPLAMIAIIVFLVPLYRRAGGVTIYHFLELRFGPAARSALSLIFLASRSLASGVALLATAYVASACAGIGLVQAIVIIGLVSLVYTAVGGIRADIYSDIMQLALLWTCSFVVLGLLLYELKWPDFTLADPARLRIFDFSPAGRGGDSTFTFWPMILGGFFLYVSYYGCDQSQAQRLLAAESDRGAQKSLVINSLVRFPLVATYGAVGLLLMVFLGRDSSFAAHVMSLPPDMLVPEFFVRFVPTGLLGLMVAGIFAASMSSLDSAINSLSAATWEDFLVRMRPGLAAMADRKKVRLSRTITLVWGGLAMTFAMMMAGSSETVVELVNKIGSAFYGPIAGVFMLGIASKRAGQGAAIAGLSAGVGVNSALWLFCSPGLSWMWWNCIGFSVTLAVGIFCGMARGALSGRHGPDERSRPLPGPVPRAYVAALALWFAVVVLCALAVEGLF
jgi:SSS family solute:Na+ symporter